MCLTASLSHDSTYFILPTTKRSILGKRYELLEKNILNIGKSIMLGKIWPKNSSEMCLTLQYISVEIFEHQSLIYFLIHLVL